MLKNYFSFTAIFAIFAMAFVSCNTTDNEYELTEPIAVNLRANINPATTRVMNDQWQTNDQVGLFMVRAGQPLSRASIANANNNVLMTIQGGMLTPDRPVTYPIGSNSNVDFIAYYPFRSSPGANFTIPVTVGSQSAGLPTEVLFSNNITNQAPTPNPVTLNFYYSLAKLEITITDYANAINFQNTTVTVSIDEVYTQADLQLANGTFTNHRGRQTIALYNTGNTATSTSFKALVLPANEQITFLFDVGGVVHRHTMTVNYAAANLYRLNFELDPPLFPEPTATLLNAAIIPREENTQNIRIDSTPLSVKIDGIRWATRNVGAPGTFVQNPEDAGMLYQWNRRVGWSSTNPMVNSDGGTVWDDSTPTGTAWYPENDPCPDGWRVPTRWELQSLFDAGSVPITYNGVSGFLFGTAPNQVFLPNTGSRRHIDGSIDNRFLLE